MSISSKELLEKLLVPFKEKYETGNYVIVSGNHIVKKPCWECFDLTEKLIHKKDIKILEEFVQDRNIKIEWFISRNDHPYVWDDFCLDFIKDYDEDYQYRIKNNMQDAKYIISRRLPCSKGRK